MSGLLRPVGNLPAGVYWVRRVIVLVVVGLVLLLANVFGGGGDDQQSSAATTEPSQTPSTAPASPPGDSTTTGPSSSSSSSSAADTPGAPAGDGRCGGADVDVRITPAVRAVSSGRPVNLAIRLTAPRTTCTAVVDASSLVITVTSGKDRIWTSEQCVNAIPKAHLALGPGKASNATITWDGHRSAAKCAPHQAAARPGTYVAQAVFDGRLSVLQAFRIT